MLHELQRGIKEIVDVCRLFLEDVIEVPVVTDLSAVIHVVLDEVERLGDDVEGDIGLICNYRYRASLRVDYYNSVSPGASEGKSHS